MGWLIALGIVAALAAMPLGISIRYDAGGPWVRAKIGPVPVMLYPRPKKGRNEKTEEKPKGQKPEQKAPAKKQPATEAKRKQKPRPESKPKPEPAKEQGGSWKDFLPLVRVLLNFLGDLRRKLRVKVLEMKLIMAAEDPCDLAVNYGRAWAAVGSLMPQLERLFVIKKRDVQVECDFTASETKVIARVDLIITLGRTLALAARYGFRALNEFLNIKNKRKGGAENEPKSS